MGTLQGFPSEICMADDYSGDTVVVLRWVGPGEPPPLSSVTLESSLLPSRADRARREIRVWREVVELLTETNAEDWPVAGPRTLSWCTRFVHWFDRS